MTVEMIREIATRSMRSRTPRDTVEKLRLVLPLLIFATVVLHQAWEAVAYEDWSPGLRFVAGVLFYGLVGPAVTFWTLDWIVRAIAVRESIEARVRRGERYLASITSSSASAIFSLDNEAIIQSWNRGAQEIFGYSAEDVVGQHVNMLLPEAQRGTDDAESVRNALAEQGYLRGHLTQRLTKDGRSVHVDLTRTLMHSEDGEVMGSSVILRDISDRVKAEDAVRQLNRELEARVVERTAQLQAVSEALRSKNEALVLANDELKQLDALKDEFVDLVSHELRAPLTNINASVELMLSGDPDPRSRTKLEIIGDEASRLTRLVQSVLDVSRMEAGRLRIQPAPVPASELCQLALQLLGESDHEFVLSIQPQTPAVLADAERASQVLGNLLSNAAKYSPVGSRIDLAARPAPAGEGVVFSVTDRGAGIPRDEIQRIFERFHRVERHDAKETYGHGLGLYIARKIVEAHGGSIRVESEPGQGSTFLFTLPQAPEEP